MPLVNKPLLQDMEDSQCRQVLRTGGLFLRRRRFERQVENLESPPPDGRGEEKGGPQK